MVFNIALGVFIGVVAAYCFINFVVETHKTLTDPDEALDATAGQDTAKKYRVRSWPKR